VAFAPPLTAMRESLKRLIRRAVDARRSSLTDTRKYRAFCRLASRDSAVFASFRAAHIYEDMVENAKREDGEQSLTSLLARHPGYSARFEEFRRNDSVGGPRTEEFEDFGHWSATTLRYVKILGDLESLFGDLDGMHIVEIGAGYGGQCRLILARFPSASYTIFDLPEPGALAARFLEALGARGVAVNPPAEELGAKPIDLVISNYALSEIRRSVQHGYLEQVVSRARRGYMLWNEPALRFLAKRRLPPKDPPYTAEEAAGRIPGARVLKESPILLAGDRQLANSLILWDDGDPAI
jgi:putative sugar O-methyltransferase